MDKIMSAEDVLKEIADTLPNWNGLITTTIAVTAMEQYAAQFKQEWVNVSVSPPSFESPIRIMVWDKEVPNHKTIIWSDDINPISPTPPPLQTLKSNCEYDPRRKYFSPPLFLNSFSLLLPPHIDKDKMHNSKTYSITVAGY